MKQLETIKQPTSLEVLSIVIKELLRKKKVVLSTDFPENAGDFKFVRKIMEGRNHNRFEFAIYEKDGDEFFAKQLNLSVQSLENYWMRKEINTYKQVQKAMDQINNSSEKLDISIPRLVGIFEDESRLLVIFEMIKDGQDLDNLDKTPEEKISIIENVFENIKRINEKMSDEDKSYILKRNNLYFFTAFWPTLLRALIRFPHKAFAIFKMMLKFLVLSPMFLSKQKLVFTHRDIAPTNIIVSKGKTYLIDFEVAAIANPAIETVNTMVALTRRPELQKAFELSKTIEKIKNDRNKYMLYKLFSIYAAVHYLATMPSWRVDNKFPYLAYCLKL